MPEDKNGGGNALLVNYASGVSGGVAGFVTTFVCHPFEILKIRLQLLENSELKKGPWPTWTMTKQMARLDHPVAQFYRGITANSLASGTTWGLLWLFKGRAEEIIRSWKPNPSDKLGWWDTFLATSVAGVPLQIVSNPIWVVKTRMLGSPRGAGPTAYPTTLVAIQTMYRKEGFRTFYTGFVISGGGILQTSSQLTLYDHMVRILQSRKREKFHIAEGSDDDRLSAWDTVLVSSVSKIISTVAFYPYQTIRSRLQMPKSHGFGKNIVEVSKKLWADGQHRAFYKGMGPAIARNLPGTVVTFLIYESMKPRLIELFGGQKVGDRSEP